MAMQTAKSAALFERVKKVLVEGVGPATTLHSLSCTVHTEADIEATAEAIATVLDELPA